MLSSLYLFGLNTTVHFLDGILFTIFTLTTMHLVYPPKFCIAIAFDFSWNDWNTQEKLETMFMQFFFSGAGGGGEGG